MVSPNAINLMKPSITKQCTVWNLTLSDLLTLDSFTNNCLTPQFNGCYCQPPTIVVSAVSSLYFCSVRTLDFNLDNTFVVLVKIALRTLQLACSIADFIHQQNRGFQFRARTLSSVSTWICVRHWVDRAHDLNRERSRSRQRPKKCKVACERMWTQCIQLRKVSQLFTVHPHSWNAQNKITKIIDVSEVTFHRTHFTRTRTMQLLSRSQLPYLLCAHTLFVECDHGHFFEIKIGDCTRVRTL